jgi:hypothetical protein
MQRGKSEVWTAHNSKACYQANKLQIVHNGVVLLETEFKPEAKQPRAYFKCKANVEYKGDGTAVINV